MTRKSSSDAWREQLVVELRLREEPGSRIGDVLAEVDSHCADSGSSPQEAFGDPRAYAVSLTAPRRVPALTARSALLGVVVLTGVLGLLTGVDAVAHGGAATVTTGDVVALVATLGALLAAIACLGRLATARWWVVAPLGALVVLGQVVPRLLWPEPLLRLPGWPTLLLGVALLASTVSPVRRADSDRVVDPRTGADRYPVPPVLLRALSWGWLALVVAAAVLVAVVPAPGA